MALEKEKEESLKKQFQLPTSALLICPPDSLTSSLLSSFDEPSTLEEAIKRSGSGIRMKNIEKLVFAIEYDVIPLHF